MADEAKTTTKAAKAPAKKRTPVVDAPAEQETEAVDTSLEATGGTRRPRGNPEETAPKGKPDVEVNPPEKAAERQAAYDADQKKRGAVDTSIAATDARRSNLD